MAITLQGEIYLNPKEASVFSCRAKNTIYCKYKAWGWQPYSFGANILFKKSDIEKWLITQIKPNIKNRAQEGSHKNSSSKKIKHER